ncbi:DUF2391 domain-containing protein [Rhodothermus profundi]|uniref:Uncharacterized protein n=1 Tax=Rhodothermus profundi TaxID=633813 RepID=A0A1M6SJ08_9BACT|nr:DUF2391 domain-containing protein [Rhodothermus profundi]SHK44626.1 hypothetical protein SAMN04488087_1109 [Rhodothermus profundi]
MGDEFRTTLELAAPASQSVDRELTVEVGWVLAGAFDEVDRRALALARARLAELVTAWFPGFCWRFPVVWRRELRATSPVEPVELLEAATDERDHGRWDFVLVVTAAALKSHYKPFALGAPSSALDAAVLSTQRLDPIVEDEQVEESERIEIIARRVTALAMHLLGHLNGLSHQDDPVDFMYDLKTAADLDRMHRLRDRERMEKALREVAAERLEETLAYRRPGLARKWGARLGFGLRVLGREWRNIWEAVREVEPWLFPLRFSRLTTAAFSAVLFLLLTAEVWELGMSQPPLRVALLALLILAITSLYVLQRQHLLRRHRWEVRFSEQRTVAGMAASMAVVLGMATTFVVIFCAVLLVSRLLFTFRLIAGWADLAPTWQHYLTFAGFVATLALVAGALGASFEQEVYFRHVLLIDEET